MRIALAFLIASTACTANDDIHAPAIASIAPDHAGPGTSVTVTGSYFCAQPDSHSDEEPDRLACACPGEHRQITDHEITVEVPSLVPGPVLVQLGVASHSSNSRLE